MFSTNKEINENEGVKKTTLHPAEEIVQAADQISGKSAKSPGGVGWFGQGSAAIAFGAFMDVLKAMTQITNDMSSMAQKSAKVRGEVTSTLAKAIKEGHEARARQLEMQMGAGFANAGGSFAQAGTSWGIGARGARNERDQANKMDGVMEKLTEKPLAPPAVVSGGSDPAFGTRAVPTATQQTQMDDLVSRMAQSKKSGTNRTPQSFWKNDLRRDGTILGKDGVPLEIGTGPQTRPMTLDDLAEHGKIVDPTGAVAPYSVRERLEHGVSKARDDATKAFYNKNTEVQHRVQMLNSLWQAVGQSAASGTKIGEMSAVAEEGNKKQHEEFARAASTFSSEANRLQSDQAAKAANQDDIFRTLKELMSLDTRG